MIRIAPACPADEYDAVQSLIPNAVADLACLTVVTADVALGKQPSPVELRSIRQGHPMLVTVHQILDSIKLDLHVIYCTYNNRFGQPRSVVRPLASPTACVERRGRSEARHPADR
jgi:hypothetical protein